MSGCEWMRLTSEIKRRLIRITALTSTQATLYEAMVLHLSRPEIISVYGPAGSGKTFTAWVAARSAGARYLPTPDKLSSLKPHEVSKVVIDNAPIQETALRRILSRCSLLSVESVAFVSRQPAEMRYPVLSLAPPLPSELEQVTRSFTSLGYFPRQPLPTDRSYWLLLRAFCEDGVTAQG